MRGSKTQTVEQVAEAIAGLVGSVAFGPAYDNDKEYQEVRDQFRNLAEQAIALTLDDDKR